MAKGKKTKKKNWKFLKNQKYEESVNDFRFNSDGDSGAAE